jgi:hypothetical protein
MTCPKNVDKLRMEAMTPDTIERLAREADLTRAFYVKPFRLKAGIQYQIGAEQLERFAALIRAEALEEAAALCDTLADDDETERVEGWERCEGRADCARAIRALKPSA